MNSDNLAQLLRDARKKDEDARLLQKGEDIYLESSALPPPPPPRSGGAEEDISILEQSALAPLPDMQVTTLYYTFLLHHLILLTIAVLSFPIYYFSPAMHIAILVLLPTAITFSIICFITMQWLCKTNLNASLSFMAGWIFCNVIIVGTACNLLQNTAPIQLILMLFAETVAVIAYCKLSPRSISTFSAGCYMSGAALLVWAVSIASFIFQGDWASGLVILLLASLFTVHHVLAIKRHALYLYGCSWQDTLLSIVQFYKFWPELVNLND